METIHISEADATRDFAALLARVRGGAEVVIDSGAGPIAVVLASAPPGRSLAESIALVPGSSAAIIDEDFARDVEAAVESHREALTPLDWD